MGYLLALDQGTSSSRSIIFDEQCKQISYSQKEIKISIPKTDWIEQDAREIWISQIGTASEAMNYAGILARDIDALAITNQRETTIVWNKKTSRAISPAIVWQDRRTQEFCKKLQEQGLEKKIQKQTGLLIDPYFSATKLAWILDNIPNARKEAEAGNLAFGTVDSWLIWNLTGEHLIDISNASRTMLMQISTGAWSQELLDLFNIPEIILPKIVKTGGFLGQTREGLFSKQIPIYASIGDQQSALFGHSCTKAGMAKNTYGTGCFMLLNTGEKYETSKQKLLTTLAWEYENTKNYAFEGSVFMAGAIVQWLRDNLGFINKSSEVEFLAGQVEDSNGVVLIPAFTGLGAPYWQADAKAILSGLTRGTTKAHIARASLEAIAFQVKDVLVAMQNDTGVNLKELRVDGGASSNNMLMQFQADILGVPVLRPKIQEITALGAVKMAGIAAGIFKSSDLDDLWELDRIFEPSMDEAKRQSHLELWNQNINKFMS